MRTKRCAKPSRVGSRQLTFRTSLEAGSTQGLQLLAWGSQPVDYRKHHLRRPLRGYGWREQNEQYIPGAIPTGLIAPIILQSGR